MKHFKIKTFVLLGFFAFFSAGNVHAFDGYSESTDTNLVEVVNFEDLSRFFSDLSSVVSNLQDVVYLTSVSGAVTSSNLISDLSAKLTTLQIALTSASGKPSNINTPSIQIRNGNASVVTSSWQWRDIGFAFNNIASGMQYMMQYFAYFVSGQNSIKDYSKYNFSRLYDIIESFCDNALPLITSIDNHLNEIVTDVDSINSNVESIKNLLSDLSVLRSYTESIRDFLVAQLPYMTSILQAGTNQVNTIIHIISNRSEAVSNNYEVISNILDDIASDLGYMRDNWWSAGGGSGGGGSGEGSGTVVDLSRFDLWLEKWVAKYWYPKDAQFSLDWKGDYLAFRDDMILRLRVPVFHSDANPQNLPDYFNTYKNPGWEEAFANTMYAFDSGHSNFYDLTSALLTDIQTVNAQHYALFYILATNILLQSGEFDTQEIEDDLETLQADSQDVNYSFNDFKDQIAESLGGLEDKYSEFETKFKDITAYLGSIPRLPANDYHFNLPNFEFLGTEHGGMEILLPLTDSAFVSVIEVLHNFFIVVWWTATFFGLIALGKAVYKMFVFLFKVFVFLGSIGSD